MGRPRSRLRNRLEYLAFVVARATLGRTGPGVTEPVGSFLGALFHRVARRRRAILEANLELAFPELSADQRRRLGFEVGRHFGRSLLGTLRIQRLTPERLLRQVTVEGWDNLENSLADGRGAFCLSAHLGAWEVGALFIGLNLPQGIAVIHRPLDNPLLDAELETFRGRFGNRALPRKTVVRSMLGEVGAGRPVAILIDQRAKARDGAVEVPFFGRPAMTHSVLAKVVLKTGTPVLPVFVYAERGGRYILSIGPPIPVEEGDDVVTLTARYAAVTEAAIRRRPEQWLWYHDRWRTPGEARESTP